jgi:hypothetical protein
VSVESLAAVLHHSRAKGTVKLVLVGIANHDGDGGAYPSVATLAKYANVDVRNVQRALDKLVSLGELAIHLQRGGGLSTPEHLRTNRYDVLVSCPPWCDRTSQHRDTRETQQPNLRGLPGGAGATPRRGRHPPPPAPASPPPVALAPPEPSITTTPTPVRTEPQHARAACTVCSAPSQSACLDRQRHLRPADQHDYVGSRRASG